MNDNLMRKLIIKGKWWVDGDEAYFITAGLGTLFHVDLKTCQCEFLSIIPESSMIECNFHSYCRKYKDKIYYFPYKQGKICCYDLKKSTWEETVAEYEGPVMICMEFCEKEDDKIWLLEQEGKKIFQVNLENARIEQKYTVSQHTNMVEGQYALVHNELYYITGSGICCINIENHTSADYNIEGVDFQLDTICYDGQNFWISGEREIIYIWNPVQGVVKTIKNILNEYTLLDFEKKMVVPGVPLFSCSIFLGEYVWFIPQQINAPIIYIHKDECVVHILEIAEEKETEKTLKDRGHAFKYGVQYVRKERYIGIYSAKNQYIFEIDTENMQVKERKYVFNNRTQYMAADAYFSERKILCESVGWDQIFFEILLRKGMEDKKMNFLNQGKDIYEALN